MIARRWHGRVPADKAKDYLEKMRTVGLVDYRSTSGNLGAWCLHRQEGDIVHFEMLTFWADEGAKETADETIGNWMSKVDRLRPTEYVLAAPDPRETVVRIDAAPFNPSDLRLLFGGADMTAATSSGTADRPVVTALTRAV